MKKYFIGSEKKQKTHRWWETLFLILLTSDPLIQPKNYVILDKFFEP